jgi:hypothetical protein
MSAFTMFLWTFARTRRVLRPRSRRVLTASLVLQPSPSWQFPPSYRVRLHHPDGQSTPAPVRVQQPTTSCSVLLVPTAFRVGPRRTVTATGWSHPTEASLPSETLVTSDPCQAKVSRDNQRSLESPERRVDWATGWLAATVRFTHMATLPTFDLRTEHH